MRQPGAAGWQVSNPPVLAAAPLIASLALFQEAGIARLRAKSVELTGYLEFLLDRAGPGGAASSRRATPTARGCQLSFRIAGAGRGAQVFDWLGAHGVACDWREPDVIRAAPVPLYNGFEDVFRFVRAPRAGAAAKRRERMRRSRSTIVGAGLAGALLAVLLARRGFDGLAVRQAARIRAARPAERGRSINLALAARGIRALERAGVMRRRAAAADRDARPHDPRPLGRDEAAAVWLEAGRSHPLRGPRGAHAAARRGGGALPERHAAFRPDLPRRGSRSDNMLRFRDENRTMTTTCR